MAEYYYDGEKKENIPERYVNEERLIGDENDLGKTVSTYLRQTVTKILLAKNKALAADGTKKLAEEIREKAKDADDEVKLQENYLENLVVKNEQGEVITSAEEMEKWVDDNFYFALSDIDQPNAWIMARDDDTPQKSVMAVTKKILEKTDNAAQFEGIIAHELGHYFVQRRYGQEQTGQAGAINEKMADMHALDCLVYMGKNPEEYGVAFANLTGDDTKNVDPIDRIIASALDEHGGAVSRVQDISDYVTAKYENFVVDFYDKEANGKISESDDIAFARFKQDVKNLYPREHFMSHIEQQFASDDKFAVAVVPESGRIDFSKLEYEQVLDKLIDISKAQSFRFPADLEAAAEILNLSAKENVTATSELSRKATLLMTLATDSLIMNNEYEKNKSADKQTQQKLTEYISNWSKKRQNGEEAFNTVEDVVIAEEFERLGRVPTIREVGERLKQIPETADYENKPFLYNGKEVSRTMTTRHFVDYTRSEREKESDFRTPLGVYFQQTSVLEKQKATNLADAIYLEQYQRDQTKLTPLEVAERLESALAGVSDVWADDKKLMYNGQEVFVSPYYAKRFLQVFRPQSTLLSDADRLERFDVIGQDAHFSIKSDDKECVDSLQMAVCYPHIDFAGFKKRRDACLNNEDVKKAENEFAAQILASDVIKVEPYSFMRGDKQTVQDFVDGKSKHLSLNIDGYARYAVNLPTFVMPREEEAAGKELPWMNCNVGALRRGVNLAVAEGKSKAEANGADLVVTTDGLFDRGRAIVVQFPDGKAYDFLADENGKITMTGEAVATFRKEETRQASAKSAQEISANFRERVKVLDALLCLADMAQKEKQAPLLPEEIQKRTSALDYLCATENLEDKMMKLTDFFKDGEYRFRKDKQKELAYHQMPPLQDGLIAEDLAFLRQTEFYKRFADEKNMPQEPSQLCRYMEDTLSWKTGEKTPELLQTIIPPMYSVLKVRQKNLSSTQELYASEEELEKDILANLKRAADENHLNPEQKKPVYKLMLSFKLKEIQDEKTMREKNANQQIGVNGDEVIYTAEKIPYYEKMRGLMNMPETDGNPEQLYQNLTATYKESELIQNAEQKKDLIKAYQRALSVQTDNLEELRKMAATKGRLVLDEGMPKLLSPLKDGYKMAEYETARYLTNPENPPLDAVKLLRAYPKFAADRSQAVSVSAEFQDLLAQYVLEKGGFKDKNFYEQKEIYDLMAHKGLFNGEKETKALFAGELKKSYQKLPETEKEQAALSMLQDNVLEYDTYTKSLSFDVITKKTQTSVISGVDNIHAAEQWFTEQYAQKFVERVGKEPVIGDELKNGKTASEEDVTAFHNELKGFMNTVNETMKQSGVKEELFKLVAEGVEAQPKLAEMFEVAVKHQDSAHDLSGTRELKMRGLNAFNELLNISPNANTDMINFFTEPYSDEGVMKFKEKLRLSVMGDFRKICARTGGSAEDANEGVEAMLGKISKEDMRYMYDKFWASGLEERAACMQRFLNNATGDDNARAIDICLDKYVDKENPYRNISREILTTLYKDGTRGKHYSHDKARFMIGAMMAADKPAVDKNDGKQMGVGDALAKFCAGNGPAWVKFGQALSNLPMLPADIREPLSVLKDKAQSKTRWELLAEVRENMSQEAVSGVRRFGKMLGAGSFWETMAVEMQDGSKQVLQMMAPGAKKNAHSEFAKIVRTIEDLSGQNAQYAVLDRIVKRAKESTEVETDIAKGFDQYVAAKKNYEAFDRIEVNGVTFEMQLMPWTDFEQDKKTGNGYKMMEMADGTGLAKLDCSPEEKKILAAGYVATELGILLGGKSWDIDRHSGQQNFDIKRGKDGKIEKVVVGIYDTGALRPAPNEEEKTMIANFYAAVIKASLKGDDVTEVMFNEVKKLEDKGMNATYVSDVQRGCIAINDLVEYQKAGVDKNGATVASQSFGQKDFLKLFGAVLASGAIDRHITDTMLEKLVTDRNVYAALAKEAVRSGVHKAKHMFGGHDTEKKDDLKIVLQARGCLQTKEHNQTIDEENLRQSKNNMFATSVQRRAEKSGLARKAVRNFQAFVLRKMRREGGK